MFEANIDQVVDAFVDGDPIDWPSVHGGLKPSPESRAVAQLETVSRVGARHSGASMRPATVNGTAILESAALAWAVIGAIGGVLGTTLYRESSLVNLLRLSTMTSFMVAAIPLRRSRDNARARDLGAVFLLVAFAFGRNAFGPVIAACTADGMLRRLLQSGLAVETWIPYFMWRFVQRFPSTLRFTWLDRVAISATNISLVVCGVLFAVNLIAAVAVPHGGALWWFSLRNEDGQRFSAVVYAFLLPTLPTILARSRLASPSEHLRVKIFAGSMALGFGPALLEVMLEAVSPAHASLVRTSPTAQAVMVVTVIVPLLGIPFITTYSVLVHRLLDARFVVTAGVSYVLARRTLLAATVAPFIFLAYHVYSHRNESVTSLVTGGGGVLASFTLVGCALLASRTPLLRVLGRWAERQDTDRSDVLAESSSALRLVRTNSELASLVTSASSRGLNSKAIVHFFDRTRREYLPFENGGTSLPDESALGTILAAERGVYALRNDGRSVLRLLPQTERGWVEQFQTAVLVPIPSSSDEDRPVGVISFGPRRDAAAFSRDDERFALALAAAAGMAADNLRLRSPSAGELHSDELGLSCDQCGRVFDRSELARCSCGAALKSAAVPRLMNGKFRVEAVLGNGGMGVVYLARDISLDRLVALKTLTAVADDALWRLGQEARTMAGLSHPHLASILARETWRGTPVLVCEYLPGGTLRTRLSAGPMPVAAATSLALTLLDALDYMHERNVLHRDVKPSNIGFSAEDVPKLLDFGLSGLAMDPAADSARWSEFSQRDGVPAGTLAYLPPEAFHGASPTPAFDLWALSCVIFESLVGYHPFLDGPDTPQNIQRGRFVRPIRDSLRLPADLVAFLRACLSPNLSARPSSPQMRAVLASASHDFQTVKGGAL